MPSRLSTSTITAAALLIAALICIWLSFPIATLAAILLAAILAPWGTSLGERLIVSAIVASAVVAGLFTVLTALNQSLPPVLWRIALSLVVIAELVFLDRRRSAPLWPTVLASDVIAIVAAASFGGLMLMPYAGISGATQLTGLLFYWDHSSHLPMFTQVMHTGSWNFSSLAPTVPGDPQSGVMFTLYPMLHVALWSVAEWIGGAGLDVPGPALVQPYIVMSGLTVAFVVAVLVWSAGLLAQQFAATRSAAAALIAATLAAVWCLNGSLAAMADYAFVNFLLAGALTVGAIAVSLRNREAISRLGWFVTPLATLAVACLYPPLAAGLAVAVAITWFTMLRGGRDPVRQTILIVICVLLVLPSYRYTTTPFAGRAAGTIAGGIPPFGIQITLITAILTVIVLGTALIMRLRRKEPGIALALGLIAPIVLTGAVALLFFEQARAASIGIQGSYYTKKVLFAVLLVTLPTATAIVAAAIVRLSGNRSWITISASVVAVIAMLGLTTGPTDASKSVQGRFASTAAGEAAGNTELLAAAHPSDDHWTTVTYFNTRIPSGPPAGALTTESGRTAAALGNVLTLADDHAIVSISDDNPRDPAGTFAALLRAEPTLNLRVVVPDADTAAALDGVSSTFAADRFELLIANQ